MSQTGWGTTSGKSPERSPLGDTHRCTTASGARVATLPFVDAPRRVASELRPREAEETAAGPPLTPTRGVCRGALRYQRRTGPSCWLSRTPAKSTGTNGGVSPGRRLWVNGVQLATCLQKWHAVNLSSHDVQNGVRWPSPQSSDGIQCSARQTPPAECQTLPQKKVSHQFPVMRPQSTQGRAPLVTAMTFMTGSI